MTAMPPPNPATVTMPTLREARFEDHGRIMTLEAEQGLNPRSYDDWARLWLRNPVYNRLRGKWPIGWVLEVANGKLVGAIGNVPSMYEFQGREVLAANGRAWAVDPAYRSFALLLMGEFFAQPKPQLFLNTTVNDLAVDAFTSYGSARVPVGDWHQAAYWITNYSGFARAALRVKKAPLPSLLAWPAAGALLAKDTLRAKPLPATVQPVVECEGFDPRFDSFWQALRTRNQNKVMGVRSSEALEWHFGSAREQGRLWIVAVPEGANLLAYAVFLRKDHEESGLTRMRLVDFQAIDHETDCLAAILRHALDKCRGQGVHALEHVGCDLEKTRLIDQFAPYRRTLPAWPFYYQAMGRLKPLLADSAVWDPSSFDGDASL